jgi:predicted nuclease of predicted toxin-antitoxin system
MRIFFDENFPLQLQENLKRCGYHCEHVITENLRGISDTEIIDHLQRKNYIFFTQDDDFVSLIAGTAIILFLSRIPQNIPIRERVYGWQKALEEYIDVYQNTDHQVFVISETGKLVPCKTSDF